MPIDGAQVSCIFCKETPTSYWYTNTSKADGKPYRLFKCPSCAGAFVFPIPTEDELSLYYRSSSNAMQANLGVDAEEEQYEKVIAEEEIFPNSTIDARRIAQRIKQLRHQGRVLDVGCGYGFFSRALADAGFEVEAIELNETCRRIYTRMNGREPTDASFDSRFSAAHADRYDAILFSQVLEHVPMNSDPLGSIRTVLKDGGICAIAVPHFRSWVSRLQGKGDMFIIPPEHINFFTVKSLTELFRAGGFDVVHVDTISRFDARKLKRRFGAASIIPELALQTFLKASDLTMGGMYINAYFRKVPG